MVLPLLTVLQKEGSEYGWYLNSLYQQLLLRNVTKQLTLFGSFWKIYYKVWQTEKVSRISKQWLRSVRKGYYKVWEVLKSVTIIKKWDVTSFWYKLIQSQLQETSNSLTIYHEIYDRQINIIFYSMLGLRVEGWGLRGAWARR